MTSVLLRWTASTDNVGVTGYNVYRGGIKVGSAPSPSYLDATVLPGTDYSYTVSAYDAAGNESGQSGAALITTSGVPVFQDPAPVQKASFNTPSGATTAAASFTNPVASGNTVIGLVSWDMSGGSLSSVTDDRGNSYSVSDNVPDAVHGQGAVVFYRNNINNVPQTVTANFSGSASWRAIAIDEFSNIQTTGDPRDGHTGQVQATPGTGANAITSGNISPTIDNDLIWGAYVGTNTQAAGSQGTGYTPWNSLSNAGGVPIVTEYKLQGAHATTAATFTQGAAGSTVAFAVALKSVAITSPPAVNNVNWTLALPVAQGVTVGTMTASGSPTSWAIAAGDTNGCFAIDSAGVITTTANFAQITQQTYNLTIQATNAIGSATGACVIDAHVPIAISVGLSTTSINFPTATDANSFVATITVTPDIGTYAGTLSLGGADASKFALSNGGVYPCNLMVGSSNVAAGTYHISITTNP